MRKLEFLINEAKLSTNTTDINSVSTVLCTQYMNRIHSYVEDLLFLVNDENDLFVADYLFQLVPGQDEYDLPINIYAKSSVDNLAVSFLNGLSNTFLPLKKVSRKQQGFTFGYFIRDNKIVLTPRPTSPLNMKLAYVRKLPTLGPRIGAAISSAGAGTVTTGTVTIDNLTVVDDYFSTVDSTGTITSYNNKILTYTLSTGVITFTAGTGAIANGQYVIPGKYATSHSQLPDECEKYLIMALERMIQYRQSSPDVKVSSLFSAEELTTLKEVFADNSYDDAKPPVTEWQEWLP